MVMQSSGAISLAQVQAEFGGANPISLSEYYGAPGVPASGSISLAHFYGKSAYRTTSVATGESRATAWTTGWTSYWTTTWTTSTSGSGCSGPSYFQTSVTTSIWKTRTTSVATWYAWTTAWSTFWR